MTDPFESLRRPVGGASSAPANVDPRFRAELLAEAGRRLAGAEPVSVHASHTADTSTTILMEDTVMANIRFFRRRSLLVAAACVALLVAGVIAIAAVRGDDTPAAGQPEPTAPATATPTTIAPATTAPATTSPATTAPATTQPATTAPATAPATTVPDPTTPVPVAFETFNRDIQQIGEIRDGLTRMQLHAEVKGDLRGSLTGAIVSTDGALTALAWFEGTIGSCGTGGVTLAIATTEDGLTHWELIPTLATGDGVSVTGSGTEVSPNFTGSLTCDGADPAAATTLLEPPTTGGEPVYDFFVPSWESFTVPADPTHSAPATVTVAAAIHNGEELDWVQVTTERPSYVGEPAEPIQNVMFGIFNSQICGQPGVVRVMVTNLLYPNFDTRWDVVSARSAGLEGAGRITGTGSEGGVACP